MTGCFISITYAGCDQTPHIGDNGNWYIGDTDTGVQAQGPAGQDADREELKRIDSEIQMLKSSLQGVVLWENARPYEAFAPQSAIFNHADYNVLRIFYKNYYGSGTTPGFIYDLIKPFTLAHLSVPYGSTVGGAAVNERRITFTATGCDFDNAYNTHGISEPTVSNTNVIPVKIVGYRQEV